MSGNAFDMSRFEAKKKRIAARLRAESNLARLREEFGETIGGKWVDQKWIPSDAVLPEENDNYGNFKPSEWAWDFFYHMVLLLAFSFLALYGEQSQQETLAFSSTWRALLGAYMKGARDPSGVLQFVKSVASERTFTSVGGSDGVTDGTILIGGIRLRQVRVKASKCSSIYMKMNAKRISNASECYPMWGAGSEETVYSKQNGMIPPARFSGFQYVPAISTQESTYYGNFGAYPGSGFVFHLFANNSDTAIDDIVKTHWLDYKTRALFITFVSYNPDLDLFVVTRVVFEFLPSGVIVPSTYVNTFNLDKFRTSSTTDYLRIATICLIYVIVLKNLLKLIEDCRRNGLVKYGSTGWHHVRTMNVLLFILSGFIQISKSIIFVIAFPTENYDTEAVTSHILNSLDTLSDAINVEDAVNGMNGFLLWVQIAQHIDVTTRLTRLSNTIANSLADIFTFAFLFSIFAFAFAILGFLFLGNNLPEFSTVSDAASTILRAMYGDVDFNSVIAQSGSSGFIYLILWLLISSTVLLNMAVGIINDTYRRIKEDEDIFHPPAVGDKIVMALRKLLPFQNQGNSASSQNETKVLDITSIRKPGESSLNRTDVIREGDEELMTKKSQVSVMPKWRPWQPKVESIPSAPEGESKEMDVEGQGPESSSLKYSSEMREIGVRNDEFQDHFISTSSKSHPKTIPD